MRTTTPEKNEANLDALTRAGERIGRALQRDELSRAVSEAGAELLDAEVCCLGLMEPETEEIAFLGAARASIRCRVPLGRGILGGLAVVALISPQRSIQDLLAGTVLVPD